MNALCTATLLHTFKLATSPELLLRLIAETFFSQVLHSSVGSEASRDLGEQGHLRLLHRLHHGAGHALPGSCPPHSHAGKTQVFWITLIELCFWFPLPPFHVILTPPRVSTAVRQHLAVHGQSGHLHAAALSLP